MEAFLWNHWPWILALLMAVVPLTAMGWLYPKFQLKQDSLKAQQDIRAEIARSEQLVASTLDRLIHDLERHHDRQERTYVSIEQFNGATQRLTADILNLKEKVADAETEARLAYNMAQNSGAQVGHLAQRLEDVIESAITELKTEVRGLRDAMVNIQRDK
jgi:predicted transcriptional regulator